jgi:putative ABC transport system substrate-binding protein
LIKQPQQVFATAPGRINRRDLVALLAGTAVLRPFGAAAQEKKMPVIGILAIADPAALLKAFREGLRKKGYIEGQNIRLEVRATAGSSKSLPELAKELVELKPAVIVAKFTPAVRAAMEATKTIPIVMAPAGAPVETGLVASLARPGGNVTGTSGTAAELGGKRLQLIRELLPSVKTVGVLASATDPFTKVFLEEMQAGATTLGLQLRPVMVTRADELAAAFSTLQKDGADCVVIQPTLPEQTAIDMALKLRLPPFGLFPSTVAKGALMSYAPRDDDAYTGAATYVDKILKGAKPGELPVEQPTTLELVINLKTAKALGLAVPQSLVVRADDVIE